MYGISSWHQVFDNFIITPSTNGIKDCIQYVYMNIFRSQAWLAGKALGIEVSAWEIIQLNGGFWSQPCLTPEGNNDNGD